MYYTYRIDFVDGTYYLGSRKSKSETAEEDLYWGSPVTNKEKWMTTMYGKTIISSTNSVELNRRCEHAFIGDKWKTDDRCLNATNGLAAITPEHLPQSHRDAISKALKGRPKTAQEKARLSATRLVGDYSPTDEVREKISKSKMGVPNPKSGESRRGVPLSEERKANMSLAQRRRRAREAQQRNNAKG